MDINERYDLDVAGGGSRWHRLGCRRHGAGTLLSHDLILEETAMTVATYRKEVA